MTVSSLVRSSKDSMHEYQSRRNLEILLAVLRALKRKLPILQYVIDQIKNSLQGAGCGRARDTSERYAMTHVSRSFIARLLLPRVSPFLPSLLSSIVLYES